jgi:hypothetical protein
MGIIPAEKIRTGGKVKMCEFENLKMKRRGIRMGFALQT